MLLMRNIPFEDLVLYSDYPDFLLERILKALNDKELSWQ